MANIKPNAHTCENAVTTKACELREPYPPEKSAAPQRKTAATAHAAGARWAGMSMRVEGNTRTASLKLRARFLMESYWEHEQMKSSFSSFRDAGTFRPPIPLVPSDLHSTTPRLPRVRWSG